MLAKRLLFALVALLGLTGTVSAQIIVEVPPPPPPKPKPKPRPAFVRPSSLWQTGLGKVESTPALSKDTLYLSAADSVYQLDTGGRSQWRAEVGPQLGGPVVDSQRVYVGSDTGLIYALQRKNGQLAWKFAADGDAPILTRPALGEGRVYFEATDNNVYALDSVYGQLRWKFTRPDGSLGYSSPVFEEGSVFVCGETTVYSLDAASGRQQWKTYLGGKSLSTVASGGGRLYVGGDGVGLTALSPSTGDVLWTFEGKSGGDWFSDPLYAGGVVYVSTYDRYVYAVDAATGKAKWSYRLLGSSVCAPALDSKRNVLYVTSTTYRSNPTLTALDSRTGKKLWDTPLGYLTGSPVVEGDRLYVGSTSGTFYAYSLR